MADRMRVTSFISRTAPDAASALARAPLLGGLLSPTYEGLPACSQTIRPASVGVGRPPTRRTEVSAPSGAKAQPQSAAQDQCRPVPPGLGAPCWPRLSRFQTFSGKLTGIGGGRPWFSLG